MPRRLRAAVLVSGVIAGVISITIGISGISSDKGPTDPRNAQRSDRESPTPPATVAENAILTPSEIGNGFALVESGPQGVRELVSRLPADLGKKETERLLNLGFEQGALTIAYKPPLAPGPLTDTSVTVQILKFSTSEGASAQLSYDAQEGLAAGFGVRDPYEKTTDYSPGGVAGTVSPGVLIRKFPASKDDSTSVEEAAKEGPAFVVIAAVVRDRWEIVIAMRSPHALSIDDVDRLVTLQASKLGL
jgi:hypothetical protein